MNVIIMRLSMTEKLWGDGFEFFSFQDGYVS